VVPVLVAKGAPIDARREEDDFTALHFAAFRGKTDVVQKLLDAGADYNLQTRDGRNALQIARERNCDAVAALIIDRMGHELTKGLRTPQTVGKPLRFILPGTGNG
jgi:ankyrin repeat protein